MRSETTGGSILAIGYYLAFVALVALLALIVFVPLVKVAHLAGYGWILPDPPLWVALLALWLLAIVSPGGGE